MNDFKFATRQLLKNPGFTAIRALTPAVLLIANVVFHQGERVMREILRFVAAP